MGIALSGPGGGEILYGSRIAGINNARSGEDRQATAHGVQVCAVQVQEDDREIALQILLLVDGEHHLASLNGLEDVRAEVKRRQLHIHTSSLDGLHSGIGDVRIERQDGVNAGVGYQLVLDAGERAGNVPDTESLEIEVEETGDITYQCGDCQTPVTKGMATCPGCGEALLWPDGA